MLYSMTGFGKSVKEFPAKKVTIEIKSLNSKQADIATRIPASLRQHELEMRAVIADALVRGKIDLSVTVESRGGETSQAVNVAAMEAYKKQIQDAIDKLGIPEPADWFGTLLRFPDTLHVEQPMEADDSEVTAAMSALREALEALTAYRRVEGEKLETFFAERVNNISALLAKVPQYEGERTAKVRARMEEGLTKLNGVDYDRSRLEQELFFYIEKFDITEEKQRLAQHLVYFMDTMNAEGAQGKKLGFIAQEMGREINTLGSKSNHSDMQRLVVQMKDELEQIKEQVLNVL
jgi:uncharacterized protein (TIGR00255 family)